MNYENMEIVKEKAVEREEGYLYFVDFCFSFDDNFKY